jgi:sugar-specific transcriptional regulator TrmB
LLVVVLEKWFLNLVALKNLQDLGLTPTQAKIYFFVLRENCCNFSHLSKISKVARSEVYREIECLERAGLVEKTLERPKVIKALPVNIALRNFVETEKKKLESNISNLEQVLIDFLGNNCPSVKPNFEENSNDAEFILISSKNLILSKMMLMLNEAKEEILVRSLPRKLCAALQLVPTSSIFEALNSNVRFNIITESGLHSNLILKTLQSDLKTKIRDIELRSSPKVSFGLIMVDRKQVLFETEPEEYFSGKPKLWTNCPVILSKIYEDFEQDWLHDEEIELEQFLELEFC